MEPVTTRNLPLLEAKPRGCGCGCGTASNHSFEPTERITPKGTDMTTTTYSVTGMTCGHCEHAVTSELKQLDGVTEVAVDLVAGGTSTVTVTSNGSLAEEQVAAALDEAGDYRLTP